MRTKTNFDSLVADAADLDCAVYALSSHRFDDDDSPSCYGDFSTHETPETAQTAWYVPTHFSGGDYAGALYHRANLNTVMAHVEGCEECGDRVVEIGGGYGSYGLAVRGDVECEELLSMLSAVCDYPVLDDEEHSRLEFEAEDEAWGCAYGLRDDFVKALLARFDAPHNVEPTSDDAVDALFWVLCDRSNEYWSHSPEGARIDVTRVAEECTEGEALELCGLRE